MEIDFIIALQSSGQRLDFIVSQAVSDCSRSRAAALIDQGNIQVSGHQKRPGYRVKTGDRITGKVSFPKQNPPVTSAPLPVRVVHEDAHIIVLDKPSGLVVHPAAGNRSNTLVNRLIHHFPDLMHIGEDLTRPGIVHRLDKDTSGLILVARTVSSLHFLQKEFKFHRVEKIYQALVSGADISDSGQIEQPIGRHPKHRKRMSVNHDIGRPARTSWQVIQRFERACLVSVRLYTGRTHQIRVHFYDLGHPLLGDRVYQFRRNRRKQQTYPRQMLHAWQIGFRHPYSGQKMRFAVEPPLDFLSAVANESEAAPGARTSLR
ncbi:MAG: RluA family pseudouridine synthase [Desulfotignum sp.]|nr:RluA family pseudouridine synthase [Desulfotignum sp.]MCF8112276.1 RluA family pseudouridine synthase [Desulfotignum sp.]MCF8124654.1 RluA family pseudouridine synthase [Desulfotignum sp.]